MGLAALEILNAGYAIVPAGTSLCDRQRGSVGGDLVKRQTYDIMSLPVEDRRRALEKLEYCRMVYSARSESGKSLQEACEIVAIKFQDRFQELVKRGKGGRSALNYDNCRHWIGRLGKMKDGSPDWQNVDALCDLYARGEKPRRGDEAFWKLFYSFYLNRNQLPISESYRLAAAKVRKENSFAIIPSEQQVRYQVQKLDQAALLLARFGEEAVKNKFIDYNRRDWSEVVPGECYISDHRQFDTPIKFWDENENCWKATRPWICAMMDAKSWYVVGWIITINSPNSGIVQDALAMAIINNGMVPPAGMYNDNGADFLAQGLATPIEIEGHKHSIFEELGIWLVKSLPYNGRAKTVERFFQGVATTFDKYFAGYLGNKPSLRPDVSGFFYKNPQFLPSLDQFCQLWAGWLEEYHRIPKDGKIHGGKSPLELWESRKPERATLDAKRLFMAMLRPEAALRQVHRGPCIQVDKKEYFSGDLWPYHGRGKKLLIKKDIHDDERVFAFEADGKLVCECRTREKTKALALGDENVRKQISDGMKNQRGQIKSCYTYIQNLTGQNHLVSPMEIFLSEGVEFKIEKAGERSSVKGASHRFKHYRIECGMQNGLEEADETRSADGEEINGTPSLSRREEKALEAKAEMEAFEKNVMTKPEEEEKISPEEMSNFYNIAIKKKINEEEE